MHANKNNGKILLKHRLASVVLADKLRLLEITANKKNENKMLTGESSEKIDFST